MFTGWTPAVGRVHASLGSRCSARPHRPRPPPGPAGGTPPQPRVAVIIPCFNDGATIREAVRSVLDQEPCELVVVNDGSTDPATAAALRDLSDEGVRVIHQENRGTSAARMTGLAATSAPYVFPLDGDDVLEPGALAALADALDAQPWLSAVWGLLNVFGEVEHSQRRRSKALDPWRVTYFNDMPYAAMFRRPALRGGRRAGASRAPSRTGISGWPSRRPATPPRCCAGRRSGTARTAGASSGPTPLGTMRSTPSSGVATRACSRSGARTGAAPSDPLRVRIGLPLATAIPGLSRRHRHRLYTLVESPLDFAEQLRARLRLRFPALGAEPGGQFRAQARDVRTGSSWCACAGRASPGASRPARGIRPWSRPFARARSPRPPW